MPLAVFYLWWCSATLRDWTTCAIATFLAALPGLVIKWLVLGSIFATGREGTYGHQQYFSLSRPWNNLLGTIINSDFAPKDYNRISLFEASPWLWLTPIGLVMILSAEPALQPAQQVLGVHVVGPDRVLPERSQRHRRPAALSLSALHVAGVHRVASRGGHGRVPTVDPRPRPDRRNNLPLPGNARTYRVYLRG